MGAEGRRRKERTYEIMAPASCKVVGEKPSDTHIVMKENADQTWSWGGVGSMSLFDILDPSGATEDWARGTSHAFREKLPNIVLRWRRRCKEKERRGEERESARTRGA